MELRFAVFWGLVGGRLGGRVAVDWRGGGWWVEGCGGGYGCGGGERFVRGGFAVEPAEALGADAEAGRHRKPGGYASSIGADYSGSVSLHDCFGIVQESEAL